MDDHFAADHAHCVQEREPVGVFVSLESGFVHQATDGEVRHQESVELLAHKVGGFAAQHDLGTAQVGLEFVERGLDLPSLMIKSCQLAGWSLVRIEDGGCQPINRLGTLDSFKTVIDYPQHDPVGFVRQSRSDGYTWLK